MGDPDGGSVGTGFPADPATCHRFTPPVSSRFSGPGEALREKEKGREREREIREKQLSKLAAMPCCYY